MWIRQESTNLLINFDLCESIYVTQVNLDKTTFYINFVSHDDANSVKYFDFKQANENYHRILDAIRREKQPRLITID
jgi:hypothetical protein